jgi:ubiquinone/menaquinone biosynthesis C-methylase UbiE
MDEQSSRVAEAFSRKAEVYDSFGNGHENLARMRRAVYEHINALFPQGSMLLEINAGTGLDAVEMVKRGYRVHATDISPGMVTEIERKIGLHDFQNRLTAQQCSFTELGKVDLGPFDGFYSNFGGLNCTDDLSAVTRSLPRLLRRGAIATCVVMPRICPWELLRVFRDWSVGTRRLRSSGVLANVEGVQFMTYYYSARDVRRSFGPLFRPVKLQGLSVLTPTADDKGFALRFPRLYRWLTMLDRVVAPLPPFNGWGDFFILSMRFGG